MRDGRYIEEDIGRMTELGRIHSITEKGDAHAEHGSFIAPARIPFTKWECPECGHIFAQMVPVQGLPLPFAMCPNCHHLEGVFIGAITWSEARVLEKLWPPPEEEEEEEPKLVKWFRLNADQTRDESSLTNQIVCPACHHRFIIAGIVESPVRCPTCEVEVEV